MGRKGIDLVLQHIPNTADPLGEKHDWYVLMEWSSTRPAREGANQLASNANQLASNANQSGLQEKMEAYLGEAMDKGLGHDAVVAQTEAQSKALCALRHDHSQA